MADEWDMEPRVETEAERIARLTVELDRRAGIIRGQDEEIAALRQDVDSQAEAVAGAVAQMREALRKLGVIPGPVWIALDEVTTDEAADALARRDAETREKALREAAEAMMSRAQQWQADAILALIKEPAHD